MSKFKMYDERRQQMAGCGFVVAQVVVDSQSHEVMHVKYRYDPLEGEETLRRLISAGNNATLSRAKPTSDQPSNIRLNTRGR